MNLFRRNVTWGLFWFWLRKIGVWDVALHHMAWARSRGHSTAYSCGWFWRTDWNWRLSSPWTLLDRDEAQNTGGDEHLLYSKRATVVWVLFLQTSSLPQSNFNVANSCYCFCNNTTLSKKGITVLKIIFENTAYSAN